MINTKFKKLQSVSFNNHFKLKHFSVRYDNWINPLRIQYTCFAGTGEFLQTLVYHQAPWTSTASSGQTFLWCTPKQEVLGATSGSHQSGTSAASSQWPGPQSILTRASLSRMWTLPRWLRRTTTHHSWLTTIAAKK